MLNWYVDIYANHGMRFFMKPCFMQEIRKGGLTVEVEIPKTIDSGIPVLLKACLTFKLWWSCIPIYRWKTLIRLLIILLVLT